MGARYGLKLCQIRKWLHCGAQRRTGSDLTSVTFELLVCLSVSVGSVVRDWRVLQDADRPRPPLHPRGVPRLPRQAGRRRRRRDVRQTRQGDGQESVRRPQRDRRAPAAVALLPFCSGHRRPQVHAGQRLRRAQQVARRRAGKPQ